jgi:hypothetical protein
MRGRDWERVRGRVIASKTLRGGGTFSRRAYVVEYRVDGGPRQRVELKRVMGWGAWPKMISPLEGEKVPLLLDRASGEVRFDVDDPALSFKAARKAIKAGQDADYERALEGGKGPSEGGR